MAARRLIVVLLVLFGISIVAAAIAPERRSPFATSEESTTTTTTATTPAPKPSGELVSTTIAADAADPETVRASPGDQLELSVTSPKPLQVEIPPYGLLEEASPDAPAVFNVLLREPGAVPLTDAEGGEVIGRILVEEVTDDERPARKRPHQGAAPEPQAENAPKNSA